MTRTALLKRPLLNGWSLFWVIMAPISLGLLFAMTHVDTATGEGVSTLVGWSVRCAVPWLFVAFAASSIQVLAPGAFSLWLLRNRRMFGLAFAGAMGWQAFFILWLVIGHTQYYVDEVYVLRDVFEGVIGYFFLVAMTVTSFMPVRKRLRPKTWKWLHTIGIYSLWMYAFSVYWWAHAYYPDPDGIDIAYYLMGFTAWGLRALAWRKKRIALAERRRPASRPLPVLVLLGLALVGLGVLFAATGMVWQPPSEAVLLGHDATHWAELYLPYWPFEPFLPLVFIGCGLWLTSVRVDPPGIGVKAADHPA